MILEREVDISGMLDWIESEAQARGVGITLFRDDAEERTEYYGMPDGTERSNTFVIVRVRINNIPDLIPDLSDEIHFMVNLQETWNNREPQPAKLLHLIPSGVPQGVW